MKYGKRSPFETIMRSPVSMFVAFVLCIILARALWSIHQKASLSASRLNQGTADLSKLEARKGDLSAKVAYFSTDEGIEAELRGKFKAVKPGESVAVILPDPQLDLVATSTPPTSSWFSSFLKSVGW